MRVTPLLAFQPRTNMTDAVSEATGQAYAVTERVIRDVMALAKVAWEAGAP